MAETCPYHHAMIDIGAQRSTCPCLPLSENVEISSFDDDGNIQGFKEITTVSEEDPPGASPGTVFPVSSVAGCQKVSPIVEPHGIVFNSRLISDQIVGKSTWDKRVLKIPI